MKSMVLLAVIGNILITGCERSIADQTHRLPATAYRNVAYGADPKQVMDIFLPEGRSAATTKVMFLMHGGSWSSGDKQSFQGYVDSLQHHLPDYAFVNVNYRLATFESNRFPTQENDIRQAVTFVMNKAEEYNISRKVVLLGASSGAHLALLHAYKYIKPVQIQAVVSFFGPTDMADMYNNPVHPQVPHLLQLLMGGTPVSNPVIYSQSSPATFVTAQSCPTLLFQGGRDMLVKPSQATLLRDKLRKAGVRNELVLYPEEGHGWYGKNLSDSFEKISRFLKEQVAD